MNYDKILESLKSNIKRHNTLIQIFKNIIVPLQSNNDYIDIIKNIGDVIALNKKFEIIVDDNELTDSDFIVGIHSFTKIYINKKIIDSLFLKLYNSVNNYIKDDFDYTTTLTINKIINNINKEYNFYNAINNLIPQLDLYFTEFIIKHLSKKELYTTVSNIFKKTPEIVNIYVITINAGLTHSKKSNIGLSAYINELHEINKDYSLNIVYKDNKKLNSISNNIQNFDLISKFLYNKSNEQLSLSEIIYTITKIKSKKLDNLSNINNELSIIMKNYSNVTKRKTSMIVLHIDNNVDYVVELLQCKLNIVKTQGIDGNISKIFNTITINESNNKKIKLPVQLINHTEDTDASIIIQTSDYIKFKLLYKDDLFTIPNKTINKLLRNVPSQRIVKYNQYVEDSVFKLKTVDYKTKHSIDKYLNFNTNAEISTNLYMKLSKNIYNSIMIKFKKKDLSGDELLDIINNSEIIINVFDSILNKFFIDIINTIKNLDKRLSNDIYLSYISFCDKISFNFRQNISHKYIQYNTDPALSNRQKLELIITESIDKDINSNLNLYDFIIEKYHILNSYKLY